MSGRELASYWAKRAAPLSTLFSSFFATSAALRFAAVLSSLAVTVCGINVHYSSLVCPRYRSLVCARPGMILNYDVP